MFTVPGISVSASCVQKWCILLNDTDLVFADVNCVLFQSRTALWHRKPASAGNLENFTIFLWNVINWTARWKQALEVPGGRRLLYASLDSGSAGTGENGRPVLWLANTFNDLVLQQHIVACQRIKPLYCFLFIYTAWSTVIDLHLYWSLTEILWNFCMSSRYLSCCVIYVPQDKLNVRHCVAAAVSG